MAYGVDVKSDIGSKGLASADHDGGKKADSPYRKAKKEEKAAILKDTIITPKGDPNPAPVGLGETPAVSTAVAPAVAPIPADDFGDGFDDGAGDDDATYANAISAPGAAPTTKKMTPAYLRGNVAGRMFRRHYYAGNK